MDKITCVITDDEPIARKGLQGYVEKTEFLQLAGICEDALQLNSFLKQHQVQLVFLDIEMPYISGIEFLQGLSNPPKVIFTTAYEQYAIKGYELDVIDYLLKPVSFDRFLKAADKAYDYFQSRMESADDYIFIKVNSKLEKVVFTDILFVEAMENYVAVHTEKDKLITHTTLKSFQEKLPSFFIQTHKSYLVNMQAVQAVEANILYVGRFQVPISKYQKDEVMQKMVNNKLLKK